MSASDASEQTIFDAARQMPDPQARAAFLDSACASNPELRQRIEKLLKASLQADQFLAGDPLERGRALSEPSAPALPGEGPGTVIDKYKLLETLGEGGFGVVYMAEQRTPMKRRVALKIIKIGMDTRDVVARFEAERQALALMDHPNIAKVFDAGTTATGRPYFVMELVRGVKITDYCDEKSLPTRERLNLFAQVCQAVQHAHQKGIIHRDLKPSNILIAVNDGVAVPKIIDFGIAKATQMELTEKTVFTRFHHFIGTPAYISPEQAEITNVDIDTRSDIYSLGVLLYELLTGKTPFDSKELLESGLDEMRRTIREKEPLRPSNRVSTLGAEELTTAAKRRGLEPPRLIGQLRGDLDWIVMKCLEKDRARRYETANGLARDIQRHLTNEPVLARPPSRLYEFQKTVRRHKVGFAAAAAVFASLVLGLGVATWMFVRERQERAQEHAARMEADATRLEAETARAKSAASENLRLATILYDLRKYAEAERLLDQVPPALVQPDARHVYQRRHLGWWHALNEEWTIAAANFTDAIRADEPTNWDAVTLDYLSYGALVVKQGDTAAYDKFRQSAIARYLETTNPVVAERISRMGLLLPADTQVMHAMDSLYEVIERGQDASNLHPDFKAWGCIALATVDYRRTNYQKAIAWCAKGLKAPRKPERDAFAHALLALAHRALGHEAAARSELAESRQCMEEEDYAPVSNLFGLTDRLYCEILLREAAERVEGTSSHELGHALRQDTLGNLYASGSFVDKDPAKALACFLKANEEGLATHEYLIGLMYAHGEGTPTNFVDAFRWFSKAASHTNSSIWDVFELRGMSIAARIRPYASAWIQLGLMCAHGQGVPQDTQQACSWFQKFAGNWPAPSNGPFILNDMAWALATARDPNERFGPGAVVLAEAAVRNCAPLDRPIYLDTLAAAYAESGDFVKAVSVQKEAIGLLDEKAKIDDYTTRLKLYESNTPYRQPK